MLGKKRKSEGELMRSWVPLSDIYRPSLYSFLHSSLSLFSSVPQIKKVNVVFSYCGINLKKILMTVTLLCTLI